MFSVVIFDNTVFSRGIIMKNELLDEGGSKGTKDLCFSSYVISLGGNADLIRVSIISAAFL